MRPEPWMVQGCHAPYVVHGGILNSGFGISFNVGDILFFNAVRLALCDHKEERE